MNHAFAVLLSVWVEVFGRLLAHFIWSFLPALVLLAIGSLPLALSLRILLRPRPCNYC